MMKDIFEFITTEEARFSQPVDIHGWEWSFQTHLRDSFFRKHGRLVESNADVTPVKNITRPILNLQYRAEDVDVKDITLYVDDPDAFHLSFLVKKYHDDVFAVENNLDEFIDTCKEKKIDYGVSLVKKGKNAKPEVINLLSIAFCDQTDILNGPIGFKHFFNPADLLNMSDVGWGSESNGATITLADLVSKAEKGRVDDEKTGRKNETPGEYIEVYEVHGVLPKHFMTDTEADMYRPEYTRQMQIVAFYKKDNGEKQGVVLFRKELAKSILKVVKRDEVEDRCAGFGGAEEIFQSQIQTNRNVIRIDEMLEASSKTILKAIGASLRSKYPNGVKDMENLEIVDLAEGEDLAQVDTFPRNLALFEKSAALWEEHAQKLGSATDPLLGEPAPSGTPFRSQERQILEGKGLHEYRRGKYAKFLEEVYRDWIIPHIVEEITKGTRFLSELSTAEFEYVVERVVANRANEKMVDYMLEGGSYSKQLEDEFKRDIREQFTKNGNKVFLKVLKDEFRKKTLRIKIDVKGKQKDLSLMTDKLVNIFRQILANPQGFQQVMQIPEMAKTFNDILEYSGLTPVYYARLQESFTSNGAPQAQPVQPSGGNTGELLTANAQ